MPLTKVEPRTPRYRITLTESCRERDAGDQNGGAHSWRMSVHWSSRSVVTDARLEGGVQEETPGTSHGATSTGVLHS